MKFTWIVSAIAVAAVVACKSVVPLPSPWATYIQTKQPGSVWLTRTNHTVVRVDGPRVFNDTIVGAVQGQYAEVPMSDVVRMSAIAKDKTKTILAATVGGVATATALVMIFQGQGSSQNVQHGGPGGDIPCDPDTPCQ